jgi:hypothetical protein
MMGLWNRYPNANGKKYAWHDGYWTRAPFAGARWVSPHYDGERFLTVIGKTVIIEWITTIIGTTTEIATTVISVMDR